MELTRQFSVSCDLNSLLDEQKTLRPPGPETVGTGFGTTYTSLVQWNIGRRSSILILWSSNIYERKTKE